MKHRNLEREPPQTEVAAGAEEFALGAGRVGALLIHGFTGSPQALRELGEHLAARGVAVLAPRLPGHGTTWQDLDATTAQDWVRAVEAGLHRISAERDEVFLVALSFGAALAIEVAARQPDRIAGIVTLAGLVDTRDPRRHLSFMVKRLLESIPGVGNDIADPAQRELAYARLPTTAGHDMLRFLKRAKASLAAIRCPILVIHSRQDHTVGPHNAQLILDGVSSKDKSLVWLKRSYHVITLDYDKHEVFERTYDFIKARSSVSTDG